MTDRLTQPLDDWFDNSPTGSMTTWPTRWRTNWLSQRLTEWLNDWPTDSTTEQLSWRLTDWLNGWLTGSMTGRDNHWLSQWLTDLMTKRLTWWPNYKHNDWTTGLMTDRLALTERLETRPTSWLTDQWLTDWLKDSPTYWMTDPPTRWLTDWLNNWPTALKTDRLSQLTHSQKCDDTYTTSFGHFLLFLRGSFCISRSIFLLYRRNLNKVVSSNKLDLFFLNKPVDQYKENPRKRRGTTPQGKPVRQCGPAIGLCRKMLRITVGGIFEHKPLFNWRYPVRSTYLRMFSVPQRSGIHQDRRKKTSGNNTAGELKVLENSLDFFFLGPQGPLRRPAKPQLSFRKLRLSPLLSSFTSSMRLSRLKGRQCWLPFSVPMAIELG